MTAPAYQHSEYDDALAAGLEWVWGEGFLSPGGSGEVAAVGAVHRRNNAQGPTSPPSPSRAIGWGSPPLGGSGRMLRQADPVPGVPTKNRPDDGVLLQHRRRAVCGEPTDPAAPHQGNCQDVPRWGSPPPHGGGSNHSEQAVLGPERRLVGARIPQRPRLDESVRMGVDPGAEEGHWWRNPAPRTAQGRRGAELPWTGRTRRRRTWQAAGSW